MASAASAVSTKGTRPSMESFLQESRRALLRFAQTCKSPAMGEDTFTIVMGNEAFDMDSNICSLVHAFAIAHRSGKKNIAPFFPILRSEFDIRLDENYVLTDLLKLSPNVHFTFFDDIDFKNLCESKKLQIILVDHNRLTLLIEDYAAPCVVGVLDHHVDEKLFPHAQPCDIRVVGSCASIVGDHLLKERFGGDLLASTVWGTDVEEKTAKEGIGADDCSSFTVAQLLLTPVLLDTRNLQSPVTVECDHYVYDQLIERVKARIPSFSSSTYYAEVMQRKMNRGNLTVQQQFQMDYKFGKGLFLSQHILFVIPQVPSTMESLLSANKYLFDCIEQYYAQKEVDLLLIMCTGSCKDGKPAEKNVTLFSRNQRVVDNAAAWLPNLQCDPTLMLKEMLELRDKIVNGNEDKLKNTIFRVFKQSNLASSRKQMIPLVYKILASATDESRQSSTL